MLKFLKKRSVKGGLPPGTPVHIGEKKTEKTKITLIDYDESQYQEKEVETFEGCMECLGKSTVTWINIDGIHEVNVIKEVGRKFNLHPLILEDIVNTGQRPKAEDYKDYLFIVLKMLFYDSKEKQIQTEQVSLILGSNFVISFQEREGDVFERVRERIRSGKGRIRKEGVDYLAYALMDAIVDEYFVIMEKIGEVIESLEEELEQQPTEKTSQKIHRLKRELIFLRKSVWPIRDILSSLERGTSFLIKESTSVYLRDVYDHTVQAIDTVETFREMISGMLDTYLSSVSNRMNEVMKILTIIATIFIPLTFIAGIYGMNFQYMPELGWRYGYFAVLGVMAGVVVFMVLYFRRKGWL